MVYLEGMQNNIYAADAATGKLLWTYVYPWTEKGNMQGLRGARGLAMGDGRIYMGTQDNHLVAVDAETGNQAWNIEVESMTKCLCNIASPPLFVKGKVIAGVAGVAVAEPDEESAQLRGRQASSDDRAMQMRVQIRQSCPAMRIAKLRFSRRAASVRQAGVSARSAGRFIGWRTSKAEGGNGLHIHLESVWISNG